MEEKKNEVRTVDMLLFLKRCLRNWYWFAGSVALCCCVAIVYILVTNKEYNVNTVLMVKNDEAGSGLSGMLGGDAGGLMSLMGVNTGGKNIEDEIEILKSRTIVQGTVRRLGLQTEYRKREGMRWEGQYPLSDVTLECPSMFLDTMKQFLKVNIRRLDGGYAVRMRYDKQKFEYELESLSGEIETAIGDFRLTDNVGMKRGERLRILVRPMPFAVSYYQERIGIQRVKKNVSAIQISYVTDMPERALDIERVVTELYNMDAVLDKNQNAARQLSFIEERMRIVAHELDSAEQAVEDYKTSNKISGLSQEAELYLQGYAEYEKQLVEVETQLSLTDYIKAFVTDSKNAYSPIPANLGIDDQSLSSMIAQYNELLLRRMEMQRSATAENPMLAKLDEQLGAMRENIVMSINSVRDGLLIMKQDAERQSRRYSSRIDDVPQQEREYLQLKRDQTLIQQVYLFLYQKREEAALTLASVVNPVKVLDAPEKMPKAVHPRKMMVLLIAIVIGGLLPFGVLLLSEMLREDLAAARRKDETDGVTSSAEGREV